MTDCCSKPSDTCAIPVALSAPLPAGATRFRIPAMDCAVEEADIRRVLEPVKGIRSLNFQLVARTLAIDAPDAAVQAAVAAIGQAGYKMQPFATAAAGDGTHDGHGHAHDPDPALPAALPRLVAALVLAGVAEAIGFYAPEGLPWRLAGMAVALAAIYLAGLEVYQKGLSAVNQASVTGESLPVDKAVGDSVFGGTINETG